MTKASKKTAVAAVRTKAVELLKVLASDDGPHYWVIPKIEPLADEVRRQDLFNLPPMDGSLRKQPSTKKSVVLAFTGEEGKLPDDTDQWIHTAKAWLDQFVARCDEEQSDGVDHKQLEVAIKQSVNGDEAKPYCFWPDGDGYYIEAFGESGHFKARGGKGFHDIYRLVQSPNVPVKMATLQGCENEESLSIDDAVDPRAKWELESRMRSLAKDIESAENEVEKRELQSEFQQLADYQKSSIGKAGESRDLNSRQRTNWRTGIIDRIKNARKKLQDASPPMLRTARHLEECICAEGNSFVYRLPEPPNWQFDCQKNQ